MAMATITATLPAEVQRVWDVVLDAAHYTWRSDLSRVEVVDGGFIEYTKDGFVTTFTTTLVEPLKRWEFDMENANMTGRWTGVFTAKGSETEITFTEDVTAKKWYMKPFVKGFLKKQQAQFVADLRRALEKGLPAQGNGRIGDKRG